jgi:hypothetical protein
MKKEIIAGRIGALAVALALIVAPRAAAQGGAADIRGIVVDAAGAALADVSVTIVNRDSSAQREVTTDVRGRFAAVLLPAGAYEVTASHPRYAARRQEDLRLHAGQRLSLRLELRTARTADTLTIGGIPSAIEPGRASVSTTIDDGALAHLPLKDRSVAEAVVLVPGVTPASGLFDRATVDGFEHVNGAAVNLDAVWGVRVDRHPYSADGGRGSVISVAARSGGQEMKGSAFALTPDHQFGIAAGGPLARNRHFLFASYEGQRRSTTNPVLLTLPPTTPADALTQAGIDQLQSLATQWDRTRRQDGAFIRSDHRVSGRHRLTLRYNDHDLSGLGLGNDDPRWPLDADDSSAIRSRSGGVTLAGGLGGALFHDARVMVARDRERHESSGVRPQADVYQDGTLVLRIGSDAFILPESATNRLHVADTLGWGKGGHTIKGGADLLVDRNLIVFPTGGAYVFQSLAGFGSGIPSASGESYTQAFASAAGSSRPNVSELALFVQDEWQVGATATVNAGLRYDRQRFETRILSPDAGAWAPRLAVAWNPAHGRRVYRAGYGLSHGRTSARQIGSALAYNGVNVHAIALGGGSGQPLPAYPGSIEVAPSSTLPTAVLLDPAFQRPRLHQFSAGVDWDMLRHTSLSISSLHTRGDRLPRAAELEPNPHVARLISLQSAAESRYDGVTLELHHRFAQGYYYRAAYTLSRAEDTAPDATFVVPEGADDRGVAADPNSTPDRAPADRDRRHRLVTSAAYTTDVLAAQYGGWRERLLTRWTASIVHRFESGRPFTAYVNADLDGDRNRFNDIAPGTSRNQFRLPTQTSVDVRLARHVPIGAATLTAMWQAFNLFGQSRTVTVNDTLYTVAGTALLPNRLFGEAVTPAEPRVMQVGVRLSF